MPAITVTRRAVLYGTAATLTGLPDTEARPTIAPPNLPPDTATVDLAITVNGEPLQVIVEQRTPLVDALRGLIGLTGDQRTVSCLTLTARCDKTEITTMEGLAKRDVPA